jgi:fibronectin-binding autotransporter adhesin
VSASAPARAGLVDGGTNTVEASFWIPVLGGPTTTSPPPATCTTALPCEIQDYQGSGGPQNSPLPTIPVDFLQGAQSGSTISVGDTQIVITNKLSATFCSDGMSAGSACTDPFTGFQFIFSSGVDITGVSVDPTSAADFRPNDTAPHDGLQLLSPTRIVLDVTGDAPAVGDQLILDVTTGTTGSFTRTVSGNWTDATGWTPNGVPNGATVTAQLVNPASGTNNVNLGGETFTVNQLQFSGTNAGTWNVTNGTIVFDGTNPTFLNQGDSSGLAGSLPNLTLNTTTTFEIDKASAVTDVTGDITGAGGLIKTGAGTLTLAVTGSIVSSAMVESGATLGGSGTIGGLVAKSGATIAPGVLAPFSTLTVDGAASFAGGSIFAVNVNAAGQNDKLVTTGATTISGGTVRVTPAPGTYAPQTRYTLITAGGGVSGTFSALTGLSSLAFLSPALSYDADDVFLGFSVKTAPPSTPLFASIAQTPNQSGIALALQAQPPGSPLFDAIIGQTVAGAVAAFDALSGEIHASAVSAAFDDQRLPREAVFDRLATPYGGAVAGGAQSVQTLSAPNPAQVFAAWGQAFDSWGHIGGDGNAATLSNNLGGLIFGADATLQGRYRLGVAGGYDYSTLGLGARSSSGNVSTTYVGLYGGLSDGALQLRGGGFYGYNHYGTNRTAAFPGFADALGSGYGGDTWQAFAEAGWRMPVGGLAAYSAWAEPFVGLTGLEIATRSFGESAGAAALNGASATYDYGITTLGLRGEASLFAWAPLVANGMIGWQNVFGDVTPNSVLAFASAPSVPFAIAGAPIARNALAVEAGADWRFTANVKLGIYYSGLIASNASDNAIKVKLEANF